MRNLQTILFLSLFGMTLAAGCTITTTDGNAKGGEGGEDTTAVGGRASGGTSSSTAGTTSTATGGTTSTTTAFTAADCAAAGATVPSTAPDVLPGCVACFYGATGCTAAVACENQSGCMPKILAAMECVQLYFLYDTWVNPDSVAACQDGSLTEPPLDSGQIVRVSTGDAAWLGAKIETNVEMAAIQVLAIDCATACNFGE